MSKSILILRGIDSENDLAPLGLGVAKDYAAADIVIVIGKNGKYRVMKSKDACTLKYIDADQLREDLAEEKEILEHPMVKNANELATESIEIYEKSL